MQKETKEGIAVGVALATVFLTVVVLWCLLAPPVGHYLGKWNDYWNGYEQTVTVSSSSDTIDWEQYNKANADCGERGTKAGYRMGLSYASSTSPDNEYETYDCYAVPSVNI